MAAGGGLSKMAAVDNKLENIRWITNLFWKLHSMICLKSPRFG